MNNGERDEYLTAIHLVQMRDAGHSLPIIGRIESVGFMGREYKSPPWAHGTGNLSKVTSDSELMKIAHSMGLCKAPGNYKADILINDIGISLKSHRAAPPAIVNHTTRNGWERVCMCVNVDIRKLDSIIKEYWQKRTSGEIGEDIQNDSPASPFATHQELLAPVIGYFLTKGTGARDSKQTADLILEVRNPLDSSTWKVSTPSQAIEELWGRLVFSIRSKKGMPKNFPQMNDQQKRKSIEIWTKLWQGAYRGALHVRIK